MRKVILDCDPGHDDAFAMMLAVQHLDVLGITTIGGNCTLENVTRNALKVLAGIPQETDLVSAAAIEPIQTLKTNYLGGKNPRLHTDEILIALSSSAASNELAAAAMHQLPNLKGCDVHSTVLLSSVDTSTLNRLGMYLTCDPVYEEEDRKYHKQ
jgi:uncharacterized protein (UPF0371 family)